MMRGEGITYCPGGKAILLRTLVRDVLEVDGPPYVKAPYGSVWGERLNLVVLPGDDTVLDEPINCGECPVNGSCHLIFDGRSRKLSIQLISQD